MSEAIYCPVEYPMVLVLDALDLEIVFEALQAFKNNLCGLCKDDPREDEVQKLIDLIKAAY